MELIVQAVVFGGVDWTSRANRGMELSPTPLERAQRRLPKLEGVIGDAK